MRTVGEGRELSSSAAPTAGSASARGERRRVRVLPQLSGASSLLNACLPAASINGIAGRMLSLSSICCLRARGTTKCFFDSTMNGWLPSTQMRVSQHRRSSQTEAA